MSLKLPKLKTPFLLLGSTVGVIAIVILGYFFFQSKTVQTDLASALASSNSEKDQATQTLSNVQKELDDLKNQDQVKRNDELEAKIGDLQKTYDGAVTAYEDLLDLKAKVTNTKELDTLFAKVLKQLSDKDYDGGTKTLADLNQKIKDENAKAATSAAVAIPANVPQNNAPPGQGYSKQSVSTDAGTFLVNLVAGDLGSTKVIVDTASDSDCHDNCPVLPLATYVSRNGAYAGINGSYFCPATYPTCAGKTNSFDLLVMNKNKHYFNSDNNVYSNNPGVIFGGGYIRFVGAVSQWGRDTGIDSMLSNYPLLVNGGNISFGGNDDPKQGSKGARSFVANKGNVVYIGVVSNATVAESARVMKAMGMENALNLDSGGSTALWSGGYKVGPGRDLPNVILFVKK
jgi:hypothetical protein